MKVTYGVERGSTGPSIRGVCRILNQNSCGSGSICGIQPNGNALILTNAHVAGSRLGRVVDVEVESTGDRIKARVIMASYSDRTVSDWAMLETTAPYGKVKPTFLSKAEPTGSHYTKGFPRCRPHSGTDITTQSFNNQGVWFWEPDAIGGQSGSGVWSDDDHFQYGLLTWQWGRHGAGQRTSYIYQQARNQSTAGFAKPSGLKELDDDYEIDWDRTGMDDPIVEPGFIAEASIVQLPVWAEDQIEEPEEPPVEPPAGRVVTAKEFAEYNRGLEEYHQKWRERFEGSAIVDDSPNPPDPSDPMFGL